MLFRVLETTVSMECDFVARYQMAMYSIQRKTNTSGGGIKAIFFSMPACGHIHVNVLSYTVIYNVDDSHIQ